MILVVGQYHSSLLTSLEQQGLEYYVLKDAKRYTDPGALDFNDEEQVLNFVTSLADIECAFAMYEQYVPIAARINEAIGASHALSYDAAMRCTDKVLMRHALQLTPDISPTYSEVTTREEALTFANQYGFPLILKPANLSKSMLVSKCRNFEELETALTQAFDDAPALYAKYTLGQTPKFIIEEFMEGTIHTVAAFIDGHGKVTFANGIVDNVSAQEIGYDDGFIFSRSIPSTLSEADQRDIYDCTVKGIAALGMRSCPAHAELILTPRGARIIEIGARLGGYRPVMYAQAYGYDLIAAAITAYRGNAPHMIMSATRSCAVIELFPRHKGLFESISGFDMIRTLPSVHTLKVTKKTGELIGRSADGFKATAFITLVHDDPAQIQSDITTIRDGFSVITR